MLAIDCGNTRIKWARVENGEIGARATASLENGPYAALAADLRPDIGRVLVANVAGADVGARIAATVNAKLGRAPEFVSVQPEAHGIECGYRDPPRLGVDRWLAMIAGRKAVDGPFAVVSAGTAVTIDAVDTAGRHLGGLILPGDRLMLDALAANTGQIGRVESTREPVAGIALLGRSTAEAVGHGTWLALAAAVDRALGVVARALEQVPTLLVTGGDAEWLAAWLESKAVIRADLVLEGLAVIAEPPE